MINIDIKENIINSSRELFSKYGYKKVSMDEIAKLSGVTKKTVYSYFKDKESLLENLIQIELINMKNLVDKYSKLNLPIFDFINKTIYSLLKYRKENKLLNTILKEEISYKDIKNSFINMVDNVVIDFIKEKLEELKEKNNIINVDIDLCSFIIFKVYIAVMFEWQGDINEEKITENITQILKTGLFN